jgi:hypothetical protein
MVRVGDTLQIRATGSCGDRVRFETGPGLVPAGASARSTTAVKTGTTWLELFHAMCDEHPELKDCRGGIASDGRATVVVRP